MIKNGNLRLFASGLSAFLIKFGAMKAAGMHNIINN
jgi:hypothetical protein